MELRLGIVTGSTVAVNRDLGGPQVRLLQVMMTDADDIQTVQWMGDAGEETHPVRGTLVAVLPAGTAMKISLGTASAIVPIMAAGGKRLFAVDPTTNAVVCDMQFINDGTVVYKNDEATVTMLPNGTMQMVGPVASLTMLSTGDVSIANDEGNISLGADGAIEAVGPVASLSVAANGLIEIANAAASMTMAVGGKITFHATAIEADCDIKAPTLTGTTDVYFAGKNASGHIHYVAGTPGYSNAPF